MPELPEVETIKLSLEPKLVGRTIIGTEVLLSKLIQNQSVAEFKSQIQNQEIVELKRRGKYLLFGLTDGLILAFHLRMTGQLILENASAPNAKSTYLKIKFDDGTELRFNDQRKFGRVFLFSAVSVPASINKLGPEPLTPEFTVDILIQQLSHRKSAIKKALLDQEIIAGLGNIYTDEALFLAGIHPTRLVNSLTDQEFEKLFQAIRQVLFEGIEYRGTTKRDYVDGEGKPGSYQDKLRVYGRKGLNCPQCQAPIVKINFGGRGTHFCPNCQRADNR